MVDVAAIFDDVFGPGDQDQGVSKKRCARCVGVPEGRKSLESLDTPGTPSEAHGHTLKKGVPAESKRCAREVVEKQELTAKVTKAHRAHRKMDTSTKHSDPDAFEERAAIIHEAHTRTIADDGALLPEPIFTLTQEQAETLAAQEQGFDDAAGLHGEVVARWAAEIERLSKLPAVSPEGAEAVRRARAFISDGWALQAVRLGWGAVELFGVCPRAPWQRFDRKGAAFGGAVQAVTAEAVTYVGGLRRYRAQVNNDGVAVPIWALVQDNPTDDGSAA
jgi:hypothetical protein